VLSGQRAHDQDARRNRAGRSTSGQAGPTLVRVLGSLLSTVFFCPILHPMAAGVSRAWRLVWLRPWAPRRLRGEGWRARWLGSDTEWDPDFLWAAVDTARRQVLHELAGVWGESARRAPCLHVFCGTPAHMAKWFGVFRMNTKAWDESHGMYVHGLGALIGGHPSSIHWRRTVAHELCHACVHSALGSRQARWADEGLADFVGNRCVPGGFTLELDRLGYQKGSEYVPVELASLFEWGRSRNAVIDSNFEGLLTNQAGLFVSFLEALRRDKPDVWRVFLAALRGELDGATATGAALEKAFGVPLRNVHQEFAGYCRRLIAALDLPGPSRGLPTVPPN
jgi:hypothetical protein